MDIYIVTSIGSFSAREVILSIRKNRPFSRIIGVNSLEHANACLVDEFYIVPFARNNVDYLNEIYRICIRSGVNKILVLTDVEVDVFSGKRIFFSGIGVDVMLASETSIRISRDKYLVYLFFRDSCINVIPSIRFEDFVGAFDGCILKPRKGRSSEGIIVMKGGKKISASERLSLLDYLVQPYLEGDVYTVDVVRHSKSNSVVSIPRLEIERSIRGAGLKVAIKNNILLKSFSESICSKLDYNGCLNLEFLYSDGEFYLMDINPRFSAGIEFSRKAGYDFVENHIRCFDDVEIESCFKIKELVLERR